MYFLAGFRLWLGRALDCAPSLGVGRLLCVGGGACGALTPLLLMVWLGIVAGGSTADVDLISWLGFLRAYTGLLGAALAAGCVLGALKGSQVCPAWPAKPDVAHAYSLGDKRTNITV